MIILFSCFGLRPCQHGVNAMIVIPSLHRIFFCLQLLLVISSSSSSSLSFAFLGLTKNNQALTGRRVLKTTTKRPPRNIVVALSTSTNDYPNQYHDLQSSFPPGTPAGLRGEAIRSAMTTTTRCIGWNFNDGGGMLEITGKGTSDFLNNKLTQQFSVGQNQNVFQEACLLDPKGRLIDWLRVCVTVNDGQQQRALILTSPGGKHSSTKLMKRFDPLIFPMDQVSLTNYAALAEDNNNDNYSFTFTLASTQYQHVKKVIQEQTSHLIHISKSEMQFPTHPNQATIWKINDTIEILVVPSTGLPVISCVGYTFIVVGKSLNAIQFGKSIWQHLISDDNLQGPIHVGSLEYNTLRIQSGQPMFGYEYGAIANTNESTNIDKSDDKTESKDNIIIKTSPLELHLKSMINFEKGCYLGQEGIASILKNPRGPPRTLYNVIFEDDYDTYETTIQSQNFNNDRENLTSLLQSGQTLYVLGSNEQIMVGTITSVGEPGGTGKQETIALALVKRADTIQKQMKEMDIQMSRDVTNYATTDILSGSVLMTPPPMDPLDGLEVIVQGTYTVGKLQSIPSRRVRPNTNMFDGTIHVDDSNYDSKLESKSTEMSLISGDQDGDSDSIEKIKEELAKAAAEAEAASAEAKRKAEKMELLKKRAEEAIARRKQKK